MRRGELEQTPAVQRRVRDVPAAASSRTSASGSEGRRLRSRVRLRIFGRSSPSRSARSSRRPRRLPAPPPGPTRGAPKKERSASAGAPEGRTARGHRRRRRRRSRLPRARARESARHGGAGEFRIDAKVAARVSARTAARASRRRRGRGRGRGRAISDLSAGTETRFRGRKPMRAVSGADLEVPGAAGGERAHRAGSTRRFCDRPAPASSWPRAGGGGGGREGSRRAGGGFRVSRRSLQHYFSFDVCKTKLLSIPNPNSKPLVKRKGFRHHRRDASCTQGRATSPPHRDRVPTSPSPRTHPQHPPRSRLVGGSL